MNCPKCGNPSVSKSRGQKWADRLHRIFGRHAFRCRNCRHRFHSTITAAGRVPKITKSSVRRRNKRGPKRLPRWIMEAAIFAIMLLLFFVFLRYVTHEQPADRGQALPTSPDLNGSVKSSRDNFVPLSVAGIMWDTYRDSTVASSRPLSVA